MKKITVIIFVVLICSSFLVAGNKLSKLVSDYKKEAKSHNDYIAPSCVRTSKMTMYDNELGMCIKGVVTNSCDVTYKRITISFNFYDADGVILGSTAWVGYDVLSGDSARISTNSCQEASEATSFKITRIRAIED